MRLNLYWRGKDVFDIEIHAKNITASIWTDRPVVQEDQGPSVQSRGYLVDSGRAWPVEPRTTVGFTSR